MRRILTFITGIIFVAACGTTGPPPTTASPDAVRAFYVGLAALQVGDDPRAKEELTKATQLAPNEPAAWANLGILQMRHKDFDASLQSLERARALADENPRIYETIALLEKQRGNFDASQANLQKAIELDPQNVKAMYALAKEKERQTDDTAARKLYEQILRVKPDNLETQLEAMRLAAKQNDAEATLRLLASVKPPTPGWEAAIQTQFDALKTAVSGQDMRTVLTQVSYFRNTLLREASFRNGVDEVRYSDTMLGEPFNRPLVFQMPTSSPAPADTALQFERAKIWAHADAESTIRYRWIKSGYMDADGEPLFAAGGPMETRLGKEKIEFAIEDDNGIAMFDFDYDFKTDVALAGPKGFRLYRQTDGRFTDVTSQTKLSAEIIGAARHGVWVLDVESDGDLDLVLGSHGLAPTVLQNNADGTFSSVTTFSKPDNLTYFASADLDEDGDADAVALGGGGQLHYFANERGGVFREQASIYGASSRGFDVGDVNGDGRLDIVTLQENGYVRASSMYSGSEGPAGEWKSTEIFRDTGADPSSVPKLADFDNNGALDVALVGAEQSRIWLQHADGTFQQVSQTAMQIGSIVVDNEDGRLDLAGVSSSGEIAFLENSGTKNYNWQTVRPRAAKTTGDQRVNSFGIGGELELRAGLSVQRRVITEPVVHFGLGEQTAADVLRVIWQNGYPHAEFDLKPNQTIAAEQRLKGSCPHLFAFDGESFKLVKDAPPWSPALGLKINAQDIFGVLETEEWFKIPGHALKPTSDNFYELRITGEYWESFYLDHYSLLAVDHPDGTEVFTDERFAIPPAPLRVFTTGPTREFAALRGNHGQDVSAIVRTLDEKYLDDFERGTFQGVAKDHYVEVELPSDAPRDRRVAIVADGWVRPTDASINVQLGQSSKEKPRSLSLEIRDANGQWRVERENLGFPAGKMKTILIDLPIGARAARLRTNMEIFWDRLAWAVHENNASNITTRIELAGSDLRYRGFSVIEKADDSSPEKPVYDRILTTGQRWRDLEGYYTRFGDVRELLLQTDNRIVLMNAGDELVLKFPAMPPPRAGYRRDFVLIGNGWIKDGDLNSVFSRTLLPLPTHASNDYSRPPSTLENDPVYKKHKSDWIDFHTRYVSSDVFRNALR